MVRQLSGPGFLDRTEEVLLSMRKFLGLRSAVSRI